MNGRIANRGVRRQDKVECPLLFSLFPFILPFYPVQWSQVFPSRSFRMAAPLPIGDTVGMRLLPRFRLGTWLLAGAVWLTACTAWWYLLPASPRNELRGDASLTLHGFGPDFRRALVERAIRLDDDTSRPEPAHAGRYRYSLDIIDVESGGAIRSFVPNDSGPPPTLWSLSPRWDRDRRHYVFFRRGGIYVVDMISSSMKPIPARLAAISPDCGFIPNGQLGLYDMVSRRSVLWDPDKERVSFDFPERAQSVGASANGRYVAALLTTYPQRITVADTQTGTTNEVALPSTVVDSESLEVTDDGSRVICVVGTGENFMRDYSVGCWDVKSGARLLNEPLLPRPSDYSGVILIEKVRLGAGGHVVAILPDGMRRRDVRRFDLRSGERLLDQLPTDVGWYSSDDGRALVARSFVLRDSIVQRAFDKLTLSKPRHDEAAYRFFDINTAKEIGAIEGNCGPIFQCAAFGAGDLQESDRRMAFATWHNQTGSGVIVWDLPPRKSVTRFAAGAAMFTIPIGFMVWRRGRNLRAT